MAAQAGATRWDRIRPVVQVSSGNFLEMYDFFVFGLYAAAIGRAYFPAKDPFASLMASLATFGVGYLMRPLGALVLGGFIDRNGRRAGLLLTLGLMALGTLSVALTPGYATIGVAAPVVVVLGRLVQGFSAGAELGGVSVYLAEIAAPGRKGFTVAWQSASQQVAVIVGALLGVALTRTLSAEDMEAWGWRVPLLVGCAIVPVLFVLRSTLAETDEFLGRREKPATLPEVWASLLADWRLVGIGVMLVAMTTVSFYFITIYTPTFGRESLHLSATDGLVATLAVGVSNLVWLPVMGALSDRVGRRPLLLAFTLLTLATAYPVLHWLVAAPSFGRFLSALLWLSFLYGSYNGAMVVYLTEIMPPAVRGSGFSLAYSLATALGGFTPAVCTWLSQASGDKAVAGLWLMGAALLGLAAALLATRVSPRPAARFDSRAVPVAARGP